MAHALVSIFDADTGWRDGIAWMTYRSGQEFDEAGVANGSYPATHHPETMPVEAVTLPVTPDTAEARLVV